MAQSSDTVSLPQPSLKGEYSLEQLLAERRSVREYSGAGLSLADVSQLLWAAQGITHAQGMRTAPSAGALYPLELYLVAGRVDGLAQGLYHYRPARHQLEKISDEDVRNPLSRAAMAQAWVKAAPVVVVFTADYARTAKKYGTRAQRYVHIEVGHAGQNLFLQAVALGLATVIVGAFDDAAVARVLNLPDHIQPLVLMPVGGQQPGE